MIGIAAPAFCCRPFARMAEQISEHFALWEVLSEGEHRLDLVRDELRHAADSLGLRFQAHAPMSDVNLGSVYEPMRRAAIEEVAGTISLCRHLDIPLVTVHPGLVNGIAFLDRPRALEMTKASIRELAPVAEEHGVVMAVENMPANINATCTTSSELLDVIEGTGAAICFDMGHAHTAGQMDDLLAEVSRFRNVHLHNNDGQWDQHDKVDAGTADLEKVMSVLRRSYSGNIVVEATDLALGVESLQSVQRLLSGPSAP